MIYKLILNMILYLYIIFFFIFYKSFEEEECNWDSKYYCKNNDNFDLFETWDNRGFQTPPRNDIYNRYKPTYQDMHYLVGYAQLKYSSDRTNCTINFITRVNPVLGIEGKDYYILYSFGEYEQVNSTIFLTKENGTYPNGMPISAKIMDMKRSIELVKLELEEEYFIWDNPIINISSKYENGQKGSIVEFFGWPYEDITLECEFLSNAGYMGLKVYSPNEHLFNYKDSEDNVLNPWWFINQPVSYKLNSRMGTRKQLKKMINTCRAYNLRIYADVIINHMTGHGNDMYEDHKVKNGNDCIHFGEKGSTGGSPFWTVGFRYENNPYTGLEPGLEYPAVPYFPSDFHCKWDITLWDDSGELDGGWISGLADLNTKKENVQQRIVDFFVELLSIGFSGFSIPNSKHILPRFHASIFRKLKDSLGGNFPDDFIAILQLNYGGEKHILMCEDNKRSSFGSFFTEQLVENNLTVAEIEKIKIWNSGFPQESPECNGEWKIDPERHAISIENPDDINLYSYYNIYIRDKDIDVHRQRTVNMFINTENNWKIKSVFSMFTLINKSNGFPDGKSDCSKCQTERCSRYCTKSFPYQKAYDPLSIGYDPGNSSTWREGTYTRVHRDLAIINSMREWMELEPMTEEEVYYGERKRANCSQECLICNDESKIENMCLICNKSRGFYPLIYPGYEQKYFKCLNSSLKFERIYFNETEEAFMPCYESCRVCDREGNPENHNCLKCDVDLIERPGMNSNLINCVVNCNYKYNITPYGQYKCIAAVQCNNGTKLIREKNICIDECKNDDTYRYTYKEICLVNCPNNTLENDFICLDEIIKIVETTDVIYNQSNILNATQIINKELYLQSTNIEFDSDYNLESNLDLDIDLKSDSKSNSHYIDVCSLNKREIQYVSFQGENENINAIVKSYQEEFYYTNKQILQLKNMKYNILIYKDNNCIDELSVPIPKIDFGECYNKSKEDANTTNNLIVAYVERADIYNSNSTYSLYNPDSAQKIDSESICEQDLIILEKNITNIYSDKLRENYYIIKKLIEQGINIFNVSDPFFQDICYHFDSPIKKDITLKDRILSFYPNITLCDPSCEFRGLNLTLMTCVCLCRFNDIVNNDLIKDNILIEENINEFVEIISNSNLEVFKCFKYTFKYIKYSIGCFIILVSMVICIIFTIIFYLKSNNEIKKYILDLTENYINYISGKSTVVVEINKEEAATVNKNILNAIINKEKPNNHRRSIKNRPVIVNKEEKLGEKFSQSKNNMFSMNKIEIFSKDLMIDKKEIINNIHGLNKLNTKRFNKPKKNKESKEFFMEYLTTSIDDLDFEETIIKDHRSFFEYLCDSIIDKQIIVNTFYASEPLRPISLKIILFVINIVLYFVVNGFFYSEDYISQIYHSENENFFTFMPRSLNRLVYTTIVSLLISFLMDCFFIEEKKIKGIFKREKENIINIKCEIRLLIKRIQKNYFSFIVFTFVLLIFFWMYLLCFNYVYPYTQFDWIKSSVVIIIFVQVLSLLASVCESLLRYISFFFKSEKIFRVSKLLE